MGDRNVVKYTGGHRATLITETNHSNLGLKILKIEAKKMMNKSSRLSIKACNPDGRGISLTTGVSTWGGTSNRLLSLEKKQEDEGAFPTRPGLLEGQAPADTSSLSESRLACCPQRKYSQLQRLFKLKWQQLIWARGFQQS